MTNTSHFISPGKILLFTLLIGVFGAAGAQLLAQSCDVTYASSASIPKGWFSPGKILTSGTYLYENGGNLIGIYDYSDPAGPRLAGQTYDFSWVCGDSPRNTLDAALFPGDTLLFLSTKCKYIVSYNLGPSPVNPPAAAGVKLNNIQALASFKIGSTRVLLMNTGTTWYYSNFTNPGTAGQYIPYIRWTAITLAATSMHAFAWQNSVYLAVNSLSGGFALYNITGFPTAKLVFKAADLRSAGSAFNNGVLYVLGKSGLTSRFGLEAFSVPSGQKLGVYKGSGAAEFSQCRYLHVDTTYAYLGLGACMATNGMDIVDISSPAALHSILPSGFVPEFCTNLYGTDFASGLKNGVPYFMVAGSPEGDVYSIQNCP